MASTAVNTPTLRRSSTSTVIRPSCFLGAEAQSHFEPKEEQRLVLERLRWLAMRARLRGGEDLDHACYVLAGCKDASFERCGLLFFSGLQRHSRRDLAMHQPAAKSLTRDEVWLLRLFEAVTDRSLFSRMIAWHVEPRAQRWMRYLGRELALSAAEL